MMHSTTRPALVVIGTAAIAALVAGPANAATSDHRHPSSLSLKAATATVAAKGSDTLTGTMHSAKRLVKGQLVQLEVKAGSAKAFVKVGKAKATDSKGQVTFTVKPAGATGQKDQYELVFAGSTGFRPSHSNIVDITIA